MREFRDRIIEANIIEDAIKYFSYQIAIVAIVLGLKFGSWIVFGVLYIAPLAIFILSSKLKLCRMLAIGLCALYIFLWGYIGFLIGSIFSISASIVLCLIFLIPGIAYNWCSFEYFNGK